MMARPSRATLPSRCSLGACCAQAGYEWGTQIVGRPSRSAKMSLGSEPPRLSSSAGRLPVLRSIEAAAQRTQALSGDSRVAPACAPRRMRTWPKPAWRRCSRTWVSSARQSVPTTKRSWHHAEASGGMALTGLAGSPAPKVSTSRLFQPNTFSEADRPGSPQCASMAGSSAPPPTSSSARAPATASGMGGGRRPGTVMRPRASTSVAMAWASTMAGLDSSPPQLPE